MLQFGQGQAICMHSSACSWQWDRTESEGFEKDRCGQTNVPNTSLPAPLDPGSIWVSFEMSVCAHKSLSEEVAK